MNDEKPKILQRMITVLDCFTYEQPELGVREIARKIGYSRSTTGRLLQGLKELNVLQQNPVTQTYALGGRVLAWAGVYLSSLDVRDVALPAIQELHRSTRETISLYVMEGNERVCVERLESPQNVRIVARLGRRIPLYAGSAGKVFLAYLSPERREAVLRETPPEPITDFTLVDKTMLADELVKVRQQGFAVSYGEWVADAAGVAAPIFGSRGEVVAVVTISGPIQRFTQDLVKRYTMDILQVADSISSEMGYPGEPAGPVSGRRNLTN